MDLAEVFAYHIASIGYQDIPFEARETAKKSVLDTLGVIACASTLGRGCKETVELIKEMGGKEESTIIGFGGKVPALLAAFANGAMGHHLDYDDTHDGGVVHPGVPTVCAGFATSEQKGKVTGREFITALVLGSDMLCRLGLAVTQRPSGWAQDWWLPLTLGGFGATATACKILGLGETKIANAFGLALHQAGGTTEIAHSLESEIRGMYPGFAAKAGVLSALLAERGITGSRNSLEGEHGLFNVFFGGEYDQLSLTTNLGKKFESSQVSFKPWPSCRYTHSYIEATLGIMREYNIQPDEIEEVTPVVSQFLGDLLCEPLEQKRNPKSLMDAKISLPFVLAVAVSRGKVALGDFTPERLDDPATYRLAQRVTYRVDAALAGQYGIAAGVVEIKTKGGRVFSKRVDNAYGHPKNPISRENIIRKFRECVSYSAKPISRVKADQVIDLAMNLEGVDNVNEVIQLIG